MSDQHQKSLGAWIPTFILDDKELNPVDKLLYAIIFNLCNERGYCWASNEYLAGRVGIGQATVTRSINNLKKKGVVIDFYEVNNKGRFRRLKIDHLISGSANQNDEVVSSKRLEGSHQNDEHKKTVIRKTIEYNNTISLQIINIFDELRKQYGNGKALKSKITGPREKSVASRYKEFYQHFEPENDFIKACKFYFEYKAKEWSGTEMWKYFDLETLLRPSHFIKYIEQAVANNGVPLQKINTKSTIQQPIIHRAEGTNNSEQLNNIYKGTSLEIPSKQTA